MVPSLRRQTARALTWVHRLRPTFRSKFPPTWPISHPDASQLRIEWPTRYNDEGADKWVGNLRIGMARLVEVSSSNIPQPFRGIVVLQLVWKRHRYFVAIDYFDQMLRIEGSAVRDSLLYFKQQYLHEGYGSDKVLPGGYSNAPIFYRDIAWARGLRERGSFRDVYGRFGTEFAAETRRRAIEMLRRQTHFHYDGGLALVPYAQSLREAAQSKICIDMPGGGDFCFRLIDYLGMGCLVIAAPHRTSLHVPLVDRTHIVYCRPDLSDLVQLCVHYLADQVERVRIAANAEEHFDRHIHRDQIAGYYLARCIERLKQIS